MNLHSKSYLKEQTKLSPLTSQKANKQINWVSENYGDDREEYVSLLFQQSFFLFWFHFQIQHQCLCFNVSVFLWNLMLLQRRHSDEEVLPITIKDLSSSAKCPKLEETDYEACKSFKVQRGCYKRKSNAITWEKDSSILIEDGYEWRKYGQKKIMKAKYLRSYYRCSYKSEQDCAAMKQVQRIQEDPPLYKTTYYGHHNCKTSLSNLDITLLEPNNTSSMFINFNDYYQTKEQYPAFSSSLSASTKQEPIDQVINPYHNHIAHNQLISSDYYPLSCDYELEFDYLRHATMLSSTQSVEFDSKACFGL